MLRTLVFKISSGIKLNHKCLIAERNSTDIKRYPLRISLGIEDASNVALNIIGEAHAE